MHPTSFLPYCISHAQSCWIVPFSVQILDFVPSIRLQPFCAKHSLATLLCQAFACHPFVPSVRLQPFCAKSPACNPLVPSVRLQPFCAKRPLATLLCQAPA